MKGACLLAAILGCKAIQSIYMKRTSISLDGGLNLAANTAYQYLLCVILAALLLPAAGSGFAFPAAYLISFAGGIALFCSTLCSLTAMKSATMLLVTLFSSAGLVIPSVAGIFLFEEPLGLWQCVGMGGLLLSAYLLLGCSREVYRAFSLKNLLCLLGCTASNGAVMLSQKFYALYVPEGDAAVFSFLAFGTAFLLLGTISAGEMRRTSARLSGVLSRKLLLYGAMLSVMLFLVNNMATAASALVPSVILFSLVNGGSTILSAVIAAVMYREPVTRKSALGIAAGIASLIAINAF